MLGAHEAAREEALMPRKTYKTHRKPKRQVPENPELPPQTSVSTRDGKGVIVGRSTRFNTNGGPGCGQYVVQLEDGRVRHYTRGEVQPA